MAKMRNIIKSSAEYTESFSGFRGIAPEGDNSVKSRLAYCENVFRDYESDTPAAIVSVPGYRKVAENLGRVDGLYSHFGRLLVKTDTSLFVLDEGADGSFTPTSVGELTAKIHTSFAYEDYTYLFTENGIARLHKSACATVKLDTSPVPYVPTLYLNGEALEARNLLTDLATEEIDIIDGRELAHESDTLRYSIIDAEAFTCAVSGADAGLSGELSIPGFKKIGGVLYRVEEIADKAFAENEAITSVRIGEGVRRVGKMAFYGCSSITQVSTPASLQIIDDAAFNSCISLRKIYLMSGLYRIGSAAFAASLNLKSVHYEGNADSFSDIEGVEALGAAELTPTSVDESLMLSIPLYSDFSEIIGVSADGNAIDFNVSTVDGVPKRVLLSLDRHWRYNGAKITVSGSLPPLYSSFNGSDGVGEISGNGLVKGCTLAALYDGRVFLSGSKALPSAVFYSARMRDGSTSPLYFGQQNYFNDGSKSIAVTALLTVGDGLYVFKGENDPMGSIFLHKGEDTGINTLPRIYPVREAYSGDFCLGGVITAPDAPLFLSPRGLSAIEKQAANLERSIGVRSSNITSRLLGEDLCSAQLFNFMGYIAVCCKSRIYLADTRATFTGRNKNTEYEWFIIDGVGAYLEKKRIHRYADYAFDSRLSIKFGYTNEIVTEKVSTYLRLGKRYFYTAEDGKKYSVYPTDEYTYSSFAQAEQYRAVDSRLFFSASNIIYVFNNDMRSKPLSKSYLNRLEITEEEYREIYGRRLHPTLYNFDGVAPRYVIRTVRTDCGVPHLTKSSVKSSLTVKLGRASTALPSCKVTTDKGNYSEFVKIGGGSLSFLDIDFTRLSLCPEMDQTVAVAEKQKDWIEKDIVIYSRATASPISVHGISFRYKIKGRIKHS